MISINPFLIKREYGLSWGNGSIGVQKIMPITPRLCICLYDSDIYEGIDETSIFCMADQKEARKVNKLLAVSAYEQIVFHPSFPKCEAVGYCKGKHRVKLDDELRVYEDDARRPAYRFVKANLECKDLLFGLRIKDDAMRRSLKGRGVLTRPFVKAISADESDDACAREAIGNYKGALMRIYSDKNITSASYGGYSLE